jgi:hypothetical protein
MDRSTSEFAEEIASKITYTRFPPAYSSRILQPLDVGLFGPLQRAYNVELDDWKRNGGFAIGKGAF